MSEELSRQPAAPALALWGSLKKAMPELPALTPEAFLAVGVHILAAEKRGALPKSTESK